jgi:hypothetical protein
MALHFSNLRIYGGHVLVVFFSGRTHFLHLSGISPTTLKGQCQRFQVPAHFSVLVYFEVECLKSKSE